MSGVVLLLGLALLLVGIIWRLKRPKARDQVKPRSEGSNLAQGMESQVKPRSEGPNLAQGMESQVKPRSEGSNLAQGMESQVKPRSEGSNLAQGMEGQVKPRSEGPNLAQGMESQVKPRSEGPNLARGMESQAASTAGLSPEERARKGDQSRVGRPSTLAQKKRCSERVLLTIPVQVVGTDVKGKPFNERTFTLVINRQGGSINLRSSPRVGDHITITNLQTKKSCPFKVCVSPKTLRGGAAEWGVRSLELNPDFWGVRFPEREDHGSVQVYISAVIECVTCHYREMVELKEGQFGSLAERGVLIRDCHKCGGAKEWKFGVFEGGMEGTLLPNLESDTSTVSVPAGEEKRRDKRLIVKLPITIRHEDGRVERSVTENTSESGACFASSLDLGVGDVVFLTYASNSGAVEKETPARVMWRRGARDAAVSFYGVKLEGVFSHAA